MQLSLIVRVVLLGLTVFPLWHKSGYAQSPLPVTEAWVAQARKAWLETSEAERQGVRSAQDLERMGFVEVVGRISNMSSLEFSGVHITFDNSVAFKRKPNRAGLFYIPLLPQKQYTVRLEADAEVTLGVFYLPETEGAAFLDIVVGEGEGGRTMGLVGLHTSAQQRELAQEALPLTPTGEALAFAPPQIERDASIEILRSGLKALADKPASTSKSDRAASEVTAGSSIAPPELAEELDEHLAGTFETQGIPVHSDNEEVRRIWRLIANARTAKDKAQAQTAVGDYHSRAGNEALAEISYQRAQFWRQLDGSER